MKTYGLTAASAEFDRLHPSTDCVCDRIVASGRVHAVTPLPTTLPEVPTVAQLLADCEMLNDEISQLNEIARRAQRREFEAVKRCEKMNRALETASVCATRHGEVEMLREIHDAMKGNP